jgi:hypothetical protein
MPAILIMDEERSTHKNIHLRKEENTHLRKEEIFGYLKGSCQIYNMTWNYVTEA